MGGSHCVKQRVLAFSQPEYCRLFALKNGLQRGGGGGGGVMGMCVCSCVCISLTVLKIASVDDTYSSSLRQFAHVCVFIQPSVALESYCRLAEITM